MYILFNDLIYLLYINLEMVYLFHVSIISFIINIQLYIILHFM